MWRAQSALYRVLIASLLVSTVVASTGGRSRVEAQGHTVPFLLHEQGATRAVTDVMGTLRFVGVATVHIDGFPQGTDTLSGVQYAAAANGCSAYTTSGTVTFASAKGGYDWVNIATNCPVAGHPTQASGTGTFLVTQGYGLLKGASGGGSFAISGTFIPPTQAGQPLTVQYTVTGISGTVTLPS